MPRVLLYDPLPYPPYEPPPVGPDPEPVRIQESPSEVKASPKFPVDGVFATAVLSPTRQLAVFYWARSMHYHQPLILLDFDASPLTSRSWESVRDRLAELSAERRARYGNMGCYVEGEHLVHHAEAVGMKAVAVDRYLASREEWPAICQSAAVYMANGDVGYTALASSRMDARPFIDAAGVTAGPRSDDPVMPSFLYGIVLGLDEAAAAAAVAKRPRVSGTSNRNPK